MYCPACKAENANDALFCSKCGQRLNEVEMPIPTGAEKVRRAPMAAEPETRLWAGGFSPKAMIGYWIFAGLLTIGGAVGGFFGGPPAWLLVGLLALALWGGLFLFYLYLRFGMSYELTSQRLIHKVGILSQTTNRIEVIDIDDVATHQTFIERLLGVGTIKILSSDTSDPTLTIRGIDEVKRIATMIDNVRRDERRRRGMYIETV